MENENYDKDIVLVFWCDLFKKNCKEIEPNEKCDRCCYACMHSIFKDRREA